MLVLTLHRGRSIYLKLEDGRTIEIKGVDRECYAMRIGIDAPKSIDITRSDAIVKAPREEACEKA